MSFGRAESTAMKCSSGPWAVRASSDGAPPAKRLRSSQRSILSSVVGCGAGAPTSYRGAVVLPVALVLCTAMGRLSSSATGPAAPQEGGGPLRRVPDVGARGGPAAPARECGDPQRYLRSKKVCALVVKRYEACAASLIWRNAAALRTAEDQLDGTTDMYFNFLCFDVALPFEGRQALFGLPFMRNRRVHEMPFPRGAAEDVAA